jgi:hypothetical protein
LPLLKRPKRRLDNSKAWFSKCRSQAFFIIGSRFKSSYDSTLNRPLVVLQDLIRGFELYLINNKLDHFLSFKIEEENFPKSGKMLPKKFLDK